MGLVSGSLNTANVGVFSWTRPVTVMYLARLMNYEGWNFNFGNTPLDWIQEQLE